MSAIVNSAPPSPARALASCMLIEPFRKLPTMIRIFMEIVLAFRIIQTCLAGYPFLLLRRYGPELSWCHYTVFKEFRLYLSNGTSSISKAQGDRDKDRRHLRLGREDAQVH